MRKFPEDEQPRNDQNAFIQALAAALAEDPQMTQNLLIAAYQQMAPSEAPAGQPVDPVQNPFILDNFLAAGRRDNPFDPQNAQLLQDAKIFLRSNPQLVEILGKYAEIEQDIAKGAQIAHSPETRELIDQTIQNYPFLLTAYNFEYGLQTRKIIDQAKFSSKNGTVAPTLFGRVLYGARGLNAVPVPLELPPNYYDESESDFDSDEDSV